MSGWAKAGDALGALFSPTPVEETDAYRTRVSENVSLEQKMAAARREQARAMALDAVMNDESMPELQRNLLAAELGTQFAGLQQGNLRAQELGFRSDARDAALAGNLNDANAHLIGVASGPLELTQIEGGGRFALNPYREDAELRTTDYGEADLGRLFSATEANNARAGAASAQAAASNARGSADKALTLKQAMEENSLVEQENRARRRNGESELPLPHDIDSLVRSSRPAQAAAPTSNDTAPTTIAPRATNPQTGEVLELRNGQWVRVQ